MWFFIYKTGKGRNWACITLLLWFIIGMLLDIPSILQRLETKFFPELLNIGATVISMAALVFLFRKPSSDWFKVKNFITIVAVVFYTLLSSQALLAATSARPDYWPTQGWRTTSPEEQGMNSDMLVDMIQTIRDQKINVHSITIVRNGYVVMDSYFFPFPDNAKHNIRSCSKSVII